MMEIAILDASLFTNGNASQRLLFAEDMLRGLKQHGIVKIVNHGIPEEMVSEMWQWNRRFFDLSLTVKSKIANQPGPEPQRGWSCVGAERSAKLFKNGIGENDYTELSDAREHFDQGPSKDVAFPNKWPDESHMLGYRAFMESLFDACKSVSLYLLQALEIAMRIPPGSFRDKCLQNASELRFNHYPKVKITEMRSGKISRIWPHTDLGVITCLFQDNVGGLQAENRACPGTFQSISQHSPSEMIVNISETLQRWTNGSLRACVHRVSIPQPLENAQDGVVAERRSVAYFVKADRDASVGALKEFITVDSPAAYQDITALEYHQRRLASAY